MYINKAIIIGNLTRDPELKALPSGISVCSFSLATNRVWKAEDGSKKESTDYHNVVVFGRQAETAGKYLKKGQSVFIEGRIQTRSWEQNGEKKYRTEIVAEKVQFGPKAGGATGSGSYSPSSAGSAPMAEEMSQDIPDSAGGNEIEYPQDEINPEDIPF